MPRPDTPAASAFLDRWCSKGPWALTAVEPTSRKIETRMFVAEHRNDRDAWIDERNGTHNLYFLVNPTLTLKDRKASKTDIAAVQWLHVDIDPRIGEDIQDEQARALGLLTDNLPKGAPPPTVIVFSGGGYQAFWRLTEKFPVDGDLSKASEAARYNQQLELLFGGDACHSVEHIMRLPGTINVPDARKKKRGRVPVLATVHTFDTSRIYPLSKFTAAPIVQGADVNSVQAPTAAAHIETGNVARLGSIEELGEKVAEWCKAVIVTGSDPLDASRFPSRSEAVFAVCCELVRSEVPDDVIYSVLTDPEFAISSSVIEKRSGAERYAKRQIMRAHEQAIDPNLREMNERHAVIGDYGGKCRVLSEVPDPSVDGRPRVSCQTFEDIRNRYLNELVKVGEKDGQPVYKRKGTWWLEHANRRTYDTLCFEPGHDVPGAYNLWRGFACNAVPGECDLFLAHILNNVCSGRQDYCTYILGWMARAVQRPDSPGQTAIVLRGRQGTGKSFFAKQFGSLFGRHFLQVSDAKHLIGHFNAHLRDCIVLFGDEAFFAGDKKHESVLKMLVTEEQMVVEAKGRDVETTNNYTHLVLASNSQWIVPAGADERRFFVLDVGRDQMQNAKYFRAIADQMDNGGREALLHYLLNYDISDFQVRDVPKTEVLQEQKVLSFSPMQAWWYRCLDEGRIADTDDLWSTVLEKDAVLGSYVEEAKAYNYTRRGNATQLGRFLASMMPDGYPRSFQQRGLKLDKRSGQKVAARANMWELPPLAECRAYFDEQCGGPFPWTKIEAPPEQVPF